MREEFEAWAESRGQSLLRQGEGYAAERTGMAWKAWKASREAVVVELKPPHNDYENYTDSQVTGAVKYYEQARRSIEVAGIKVK